MTWPIPCDGAALKPISGPLSPIEPSTNGLRQARLDGGSRLILD
jgi:hypothetical protein